MGNLIGKILIFLYGGEYIEPHKGAMVYAVKRIFPPFAAGQTWGRYIFIKRQFVNRPTIIRHEYIHVQQWEKYPWTFIPRYAWYTIIAGMRYGWKSAYRKNKFEAEAYTRQNEIL